MGGGAGGFEGGGTCAFPSPGEIVACSFIVSICLVRSLRIYVEEGEEASRVEARGRDALGSELPTYVDS